MSYLFRLQGIKIYWLIQFLEYLRTLSLKFQKARTKIEVVLSLPCWLSQSSEPSERSIFQNFWKPDRCPDFLFLELETSNFCYLHFFLFSITVQSFRKIGQHWFNIFYKGPPFNVFWFCNLPKIQRWDPYKMSNINVVKISGEIFKLFIW